MKGNKKILLLLILVLLITVCFGTYAIYRASGSANGSIKAAAWSVKIDGTDIASANYTFDASNIVTVNSYFKNYSRYIYNNTNGYVLNSYLDNVEITN